MIVVDFPDAMGCQVSLKVTGHAGLADKGNDIICAAISSLVQTFAGGVESSLEGLVKGHLEAGNCNLTITVPQGQQNQLRAVCKVFKFGFLKISESYPEQVKLN